MKLPPDVTIRHDLRPGDLESIVALHVILYGNEYGWDTAFQEHVSGPLAEFREKPPKRSKIWIVEHIGTLAGSIAIVESSKENAQLRWLLLHPELRGLGLGRMLIADALDFCREQGYQSVFLWTEARLTAAARLYGLFGFKLTEEKTHKLWGTTVTEQRYDLQL
jgi:GNAT superfamily N-acetyltransferase